MQFAFILLPLFVLTAGALTSGVTSPADRRAAGTVQIMPVPAMAFVQDCLLSGPTPENGASPAPTIDDNGTTTGTNGSGCDGCTVNWNVTITWHHTGSGSYIVNGVVITDDNVVPGDVTHVQGTGTIDMGCDSEQKIAATNNQGGNSNITVKCNKCQ